MGWPHGVVNGPLKENSNSLRNEGITVLRTSMKMACGKMADRLLRVFISGQSIIGVKYFQRDWSNLVAFPVFSGFIINEQAMLAYEITYFCADWHSF